MVSDAKRIERAGRKKLQDHAKRMRREPTLAEARFWHYAKNRGIGVMKFRRQVAVGPYVADFCVRRNGSSSRSTGASMARKAMRSGISI